MVDKQYLESMLNSKRFSRHFGAVTVVCITSLLVTIGGCSASQTPNTSSSPESRGTSDAVEPEHPEPSTNTTNSTLAQVKQYQDVPQAFQGVWQADLEQCSAPVSETSP